jgi:hypothetical protein
VIDATRGGRQIVVCCAILVAAIACSDVTGTVLPNPPESVSATLINRVAVSLQWAPRPSRENVVSFGVYRDGRKIGETASTSYTDSTAPENQTHVYAVSSRSADGAVSELSATTSIYTPDGTPPRILSVLPAAAAVNVDPQPTLRVIFSEPLDPASVTSSVAVKTAAGITIAGTTSYVASTNSIQWIPAGNIAFQERVQATISTAVTDTAGNHLKDPFSFSFTIREGTAPFVVSMSLPDGSTGVSLYARPTFTFSEPMSRVFCYAMTEAGTNNGITAIPSFQDSAHTIVAIIPYGGYKPNTTYTLTLEPGGARDLVGNVMPGTLSVTFTYGSDFLLPALVSMSPATGAKDVSVASPTFTFEFDRTLIHTDGYNVTFDLTTGGTPVIGGSFIYPVDSKSITFTAPQLQPNTTYRLILTERYVQPGMQSQLLSPGLTFTTAK